MSSHEEVALQRLALELLTMFPHVAAPEVDLLLAGLRANFGDAPIREFLPVLIRRAARDHLAGRSQPAEVGIVDLPATLPVLPHLVA